MKKLIAIILCVTMVFGFAACGKKENTADVPEVPEVVDNPGIQLTDNLPIVSLFGKYEASNIETAKGWDILYALNGLDNADYLGVAVFCKEDKGDSLKAVAEKEAKARYEEQELVVAEGDSLFSKSNVPYSYFVSFEGEKYDVPAYAKHYFVADAGEVFELEFFIETEVKLIADGKIGGCFPLDFKTAESYELKADGPKERYTSVNGDFANLDVYTDDADGLTMDQLVKGLKEDYKPDYIEEYTVELANGTKQDCVYFNFHSHNDGKAYVNYSIMTMVDGKLICLNFWQFEEDANPITSASIPAFMWSFDKAE